MPSRTLLVRPATPLVPETVALAPADQFMIRCFITPVLCFALDTNVSIEEVASELQQGLANTIAELPFLAGALVSESEEMCTQQVDIQENAGVELRVNDMRHLSGGPLYDFDKLVEKGIPPSCLDFDLLVPGLLIPEPEPMCLAVQANFIRGGLLLVTHVHHSVMDGSGLFSFLRCLSKYTAAISRSQFLPPNGLLATESLDRTVLSPGPARREMIDFPGFRPANEESWSPKADSGKLLRRLLAQLEQDKWAKISKSWWSMSPDQFRRLEENVMAAQVNSVPPTQNSILSAFFWRHISRARGLEERGVQYTNLMTVCDFRARLEPPLPYNYVGNAVMFAKTQVSVADICSDEPDMLYRTATNITESIHWWDSDKIESLMGAVEVTDMKSIEWDYDCHFGSDLQITSTLSSASPYDFDWGRHLGKMQALRFPNGAFYDGFVTVLPRLPDGSIEFCVNGGTEELNRLRADQQFTKFAQFMCC